MDFTRNSNSFGNDNMTDLIQNLRELSELSELS
jgi:hypothetical protein